MPDPFAAISAGAAVVQFVELAAKLVTETKEVYETGSTAGHLQIRDVTHDLIYLIGRLHTDPGADASPSGQVIDAHLKRVASDCHAQALLLLQELRTVGPSSPASKRSSAAAALRTAWKRKRLDALETRLGNYKQQLALDILVNLRRDTSLMNLKHDARFDRLDCATKDIIEKMLLSKDDITLCLHQHFEAQKLERDRQHAETLSAIDRLNLPPDPTIASGKGRRRNRPERPLPNSTDDNHYSRIATRRQLVLNGLKFRAMRDRQESLDQAHKKTFEWIFKPAEKHPSYPRATWSDFSEFLRSGDGCYWIKGKAGSGKSTLMKFICEHTQTEKLLRLWASGRPLVTADVFFWNFGVSEQKSKCGLWRSILYQVLSKVPILDLVQDTLPGMWDDAGRIMARRARRTKTDRSDHFEKDYPEFVEPPTETELRRALKTMMRSIRDWSMCLMIDGVDEYDDDQVELCCFLRQLASEGVKLVISSRPSLICEEAFSTCPSLKLPDLTYLDVQRYIIDRIGSHPRLDKLLLRGSQGEYRQFMEEITSKASGVFLWAKFAIAELLSGLRNEDSMPDLQRRLQRLPPDLEDLYKAMFQKMDSNYRMQASQLIQLFERAQEAQPTVPIRAILLSFADESDSRVALRADSTPLSPGSISHRVAAIERRLLSRCCGLLEVHRRGPNELHYAEVQYIHRTVGDFLRLDHVWQEIVSWTHKTAFDVDVKLALGNLLMLKKTILLDEFESAYKTSISIMLYINRALSPAGSDLIAVYLQIYHLIETELIKMPINGLLFWESQKSEKNKILGPLELAMVCGLESIVVSVVHRDPQLVKTNPVLHWALDSHLRSAGIHARLPTLDFLAFLLQSGAEVNAIHHGISAWTRLLIKTQFTRFDNQTDVWYSGAIRLFLKYGADPHAAIRRGAKPYRNDTLTLIDIVKLRFVEKNKRPYSTRWQLSEIGVNLCVFLTELGIVDTDPSNINQQVIKQDHDNGDPVVFPLENIFKGTKSQRLQLQKKKKSSGKSPGPVSIVAARDPDGRTCASEENNSRYLSALLYANPRGSSTSSFARCE